MSEWVGGWVGGLAGAFQAGGRVGWFWLSE